MKRYAFSASAVVCLVVALAMPVNAAQAGILTDAAKAAKAKLGGGVIKKGVKDSVWLARCGVKVLRKKPCIEFNFPK